MKCQFWFLFVFNKLYLVLVVIRKKNKKKSLEYKSELSCLVNKSQNNFALSLLSERKSTDGN